jgi:hypothetical protein
MGLSFWSKILLEVTSGVLAVLSVFYPYLGIPVAVIVLVLVLNEITTRKSERADFKKKIIHELWTMGNMLIDIPIGEGRPIFYNEWSSKDASFEKDALGGDYDLWKRFYDSIDARNDFFAPRDAFHIEDSVKLRRSCVENFSQIVGTSMVQQSALKKRFDDLVASERYRWILRPQA